MTVLLFVLLVIILFGVGGLLSALLSPVFLVLVAIGVAFLLFGRGHIRR